MFLASAPQKLFNSSSKLGSSPMPTSSLYKKHGQAVHHTMDKTSLSPPLNSGFDKRLSLSLSLQIPLPFSGLAILFITPAMLAWPSSSAVFHTYQFLSTYPQSVVASSP
jgi:hypothetical protein